MSINTANLKVGLRLHTGSFSGGGGGGGGGGGPGGGISQMTYFVCVCICVAAMHILLNTFSRGPVSQM